MDSQLPNMEKTMGKMDLACSGRDSWKIFTISLCRDVFWVWGINLDLGGGKV